MSDIDQMPKETNKEKALSALLGSSSIADAAKKCGLSEKTLRRYLEEKEFLAEYRAARRQIVENAIAKLQSSASEAVQTLIDNLHCENPAAENRAAQIILENAVKGVETIDILERLEVLEDEHNKQNPKT